MKQPQRRIVLSIEIEADSWDDVSTVGRFISDEIDRHAGLSSEKYSSRTFDFYVSEKMTYQARIRELAKTYGSVRAVGRALDIDHAYLHRLADGTKSNPSSEVLKKLGLEKSASS